MLGAISIHALREEGDDHTRQTPVSRLTFLSTPSARRATKAIDDYTMQLIISIHALREEGDRRRPHQRPAGGISIHALREEGDPIVFRLYLKLEVFLSTPSARRATRSAATRRRRCSNFYPRPPRGGRLVCAKNKTPAFVFLSTPSARRATRLNFRASSIVGYFYPRPPRGGRRAVHRPLRGREDISIHALREEGDWRVR